MKNVKRTITIVVILLLVVLMIARLKGNHDKIESGKKQGSELTSVVTVDVASVKRQDADRNLTLVGTLSAGTEIVVAAEAQGKITSLNLELGQYKSKGSVIAVVDNRLKQLAVETAQVSLNKQKKDLERYENLAKGGSVTQQQLDDARTSFENAKIQLDQAKKQLADATITSPVNGFVVQKNVEHGAFVNIGNPIATIVDVSKLKIKLNVSEMNVYSLKVGDKTTITTDVYPGVTFTGRISFVSAKGDDSHNYPVEVELANNSKYNLKSGTFINVHIDLPSKGTALFIPREALQGSTQDAKVYVAENGKANLRKIVIGGGNDSHLMVMSGLSEGEKVVISGQVNLSEGREIKIIESK